MWADLFQSIALLAIVGWIFQHNKLHKLEREIRRNVYRQD